MRAITQKAILWAAVALLALPVTVRALDFECTTNAGKITITGYIGPGGSVTIPATIDTLPVVGIAKDAFNDCTSITSMIIPTNVTTIGESAFYNCVNMTSVSLPTSLRTIGQTAFNRCTRLTSVTIPTGVTSIGVEAFMNCYALTSVTIPASVTSIGFLAFSYCSSLTSITVNGSNPSYSSVNGVLFNKQQTTLIQYPGGKTGSYTVPGSVSSIGLYAFCYGKLTSVIVPDGVTTIGDSAFASSIGQALTGVYFCGNPPVPGTAIFNLTTGTTVYYLPDATGWDTTYAGRPTAIWVPYTYATNNGAITITGYTAPCSGAGIPGLIDGLPVTGIRSNAFYGNTYAASVTVPAGVTNVGDLAFAFCTNLTAVYFTGDAPDVGTNVFLNSTNVTVYYLPGTTGWGPTLGGRPAVLWNPHALGDNTFGVLTNHFGFTIAGTSNLVIVVQACTNLVNPVWTPLGTNTLLNGSSYFFDSHSGNYPVRFYRFHSP